MTKLLSIIVPIYNEERLIKQSLPAIFALPINKEVIIINDGSTDKTSLILDELKQKYNFTYLNQTKNQGKGAAVKRGLENIKGDYFIICGADLEYDTEDICRLFKETEKITDKKMVIYGSRFKNSKKLNFHTLVNRALTLFTNILFKTKLTDMETCFKLIPSSALKDISLTGKRFEIEPEITARLIKQKYTIIEFPINYTRRSYQEGKKITAKDGFLAVKTLIKEKLNK